MESAYEYMSGVGRLRTQQTREEGFKRRGKGRGRQLKWVVCLGEDVTVCWCIRGTGKTRKGWFKRREKWRGGQWTWMSVGEDVRLTCNRDSNAIHQQGMA